MKEKVITIVLACSYNGCLIVGLIGIILYAFGLQKCKNTASISIGIYLVLSILGKCLK
ncbi:hypothetical protein [Terrisporobacter mayombei]|uniref:Uncharacterized protein n=1 Tax=Terrisporobacter mayombei TaxID=1541 RepID=A0ABY9PYE8_9FIRM|nr:hypothetical protein [Terrisporobacter mayombei]MCC3868530.1 hypothetical protein [Terrisporobacter mayombei]WMT80687.1 hypothetical protein TEMA_10080 [Terrisporobacter mayombei]